MLRKRVCMSQPHDPSCFIESFVVCLIVAVVIRIMDAFKWRSLHIIVHGQVSTRKKVNVWPYLFICHLLGQCFAENKDNNLSRLSHVIMKIFFCFQEIMFIATSYPLNLYDQRRMHADSASFTFQTSYFRINFDGKSYRNQIL